MPTSSSQRPGSASGPLVVYTTVHQGSLKYLADWCASVARQTDPGFDLFIAADAVPAQLIRRELSQAGCRGEVWEVRGASAAQIRQQAFSELSSRYWGLVLTDSDDILHPTRVASARAWLARYEMAGCALRLITEEGKDAGSRLVPDGAADAAALLSRHNVFGLSNTAYRARLMQDCLPIPACCELIDWLLASRAWIRNAAIGFDPSDRMYYRQHGGNIAGLLGPFSAHAVLTATRRVLGHYELLLQSTPGGCARVQEIYRAYENVAAFQHAVTGSEQILESYVAALNSRPPGSVWWWQVAHPALEFLWRN